MTAPVQQHPAQPTDWTLTQKAAAVLAAIWAANSIADATGNIATITGLPALVVVPFLHRLWPGKTRWRYRPSNPAAQYQAQYITDAADRIMASIRHGDGIGQALAREQRFLTAHRAAQRKRNRQAAAIRKAQRQYGNMLGWHAVLDDRTTPACVAANGHNFDARYGPFPGIHQNCRCRPGIRFATRITVLQAWDRAGLAGHGHLNKGAA